MSASLRQSPQFPPRRTMMAWLGLLALLFHSLLPVAYHSLQQRNAMQAGFDSIVICTAYGMRTVLLGADGQPVPEQDAPADKNNTARYCPICIGSQQAGSGILPAALLLAAPAFLAAIVFAQPSDAPHAAPHDGQARARAPPASL